MSRLVYVLAAALALAVAWLLWKPLLGGTPLGAPSPDLFLAIEDSDINRRLPEINFNGEGLADIIDFFRDVSGSSIFVNWRELEAAGIAKDTPVKVHIQPNTRFAQALKLVLADAGRSVPLVAFVGDGCIDITTESDRDFGKYLWGFDVADLVDGKSDATRLAFGFNPFHPTPRPQKELLEDLEKQLKARFGESSINSRDFYPGEKYLMGKWSPSKPTVLQAISTRAGHRQIADDLAWRRWLPGAQAFAMRAGVLTAGALLAMRTARSPMRRRRKRLQQGVCMNCGYDLRASPGRCPECGEMRGDRA